MNRDLWIALNIFALLSNLFASVRLYTIASFDLFIVFILEVFSISWIAYRISLLSRLQGIMNKIKIPRFGVKTP